jgi:HK97 family phage prohead protease
VIVSPSFSIEKSLGEGRFAGLAWSFLDTPDREGDVILPSALEAVVATGRMPEVRIEHQKGDVAGAITSWSVSPRGLEVEGRVDLGVAVGRKAYDQLQARELGALSIGFQGAAEKSGRTRVFTSIELEEVSLCREPMNAGSRIHAVKSWSDVGSERELEGLLKQSAGMPNRLARKAAGILWPAINEGEDDSDALALVNHLNSITAMLRS